LVILGTNAITGTNFIEQGSYSVDGSISDGRAARWSEGADLSVEPFAAAFRAGGARADYRARERRPVVSKMPGYARYIPNTGTWFNHEGIPGRCRPNPSCSY
jgi:hypothetical protein